MFEPLRQIGVDGPGIRRLLKNYGRGLIQRWVRITDAAMHEKPRGFQGFKVSSAAFLIDAVHNNRTPPDWLYAHEKRRRQEQWEIERAATGEDSELLALYDQERAAALREFLASEEGRLKYEQAFEPYLAFYKATDPHRYREEANGAAIARVERLDFKFPEYDLWSLTCRYESAKKAA